MISSASKQSWRQPVLTAFKVLEDVFLWFRKSPQRHNSLASWTWHLEHFPLPSLAWVAPMATLLEAKSSLSFYSCHSCLFFHLLLLLLLVLFSSWSSSSLSFSSSFTSSSVPSLFLYSLWSPSFSLPHLSPPSSSFCVSFLLLFLLLWWLCCFVTR